MVYAFHWPIQIKIFQTNPEWKYGNENHAGASDRKSSCEKSLARIFPTWNETYENKVTANNKVKYQQRAKKKKFAYL